MVMLPKRAFRATRWAAAQLWLRIWPNIDTIGVAGSVGKTTTKEIIAGVLEQTFRTVKTPANWDPIFNLPITALKTWGECKFVAELSVDGVGQMDTYLTLVQPRIGVLTRLTLEHTDEAHFGTLETAIAEEIKLLGALPPYGWAILNGDDTEIQKVVPTTQAHTLLYGFGPKNDLRIAAFKQLAKGPTATTTFDIIYDTGRVTFTTQLLGKHHASAACAGVAVGLVMGMPFEAIQKGLSTITPVTGRLNPKQGRWGLVIDDTYNASPAAVEAAIDTLVEFDPQNGILVLGDMLELGNYAREAHYRIGRYAKEKGVGALAAYGNHAADVTEGYKSNKPALVAQTHTEIIEWVTRIGKGTVLVKGSRSMHMERVVEGLTT